MNDYINEGKIEVNDYKEESKIDVVITEDDSLVEVSQNVVSAESESNANNPQPITILENEDRAGLEDCPNKSMVRTLIESVKVNRDEELDAQVDQLIVKNDGLWECKICGKTTLYNTHMRQHTETHIKGVSHTCPMCSKIFANRHTLRNHISGIHSELFTCDVCGKSGMNKHAYRAHQRRPHKVFSAKH